MTRHYPPNMKRPKTGQVDWRKLAEWRGPSELPQAAAWYLVRRPPDQTEKVRAFGQGHWWIPLPDGWLSADGCYEWKPQPICAIAADDDEITPIQEMDRAQKIMEGQVP